MKKLVIIGALLIGAACTPNVEQNPAPTQVHALFDPAQNPAVVPSPNDLAISPATGKVAVPAPPNATKADLDLIAYLSTLDGFPADSTASADFDGALDPATVTTSSVRVTDLTAGGTAVPGYTVGVKTVSFGNAKSELDIGAPPAGWVEGHAYAVALVAGANGIKGTGGVPVVGSPVWGLVKSTQPLVTCADLKTNCQSTTSLIPDGTSAVQLEMLRLHYKPLLDRLQGQGVARADVPLLWSFKVASGPTLAFQPAAAIPVVPIPNDLAKDPKTGKLAIPVDPRTSAANREFTTDYLNNLNGYPVATAGSTAVQGGDLDATTVVAQTVQVLDVTQPADGGTPFVPPGATISYDATGHAIDIVPPTNGWAKGHTYAVVAIAGAHGLQGTGGTSVVASTVWALVRSPDPLVDCTDLTSTSCKSQITVVNLSDADAVKLEQLRRGYAPLLQSFEAQGVSVNDLAIAWTFTIFSNPEATFDPTRTTGTGPAIPFPNNLALGQYSDGGVHVNLPGCSNISVQGLLICGLDTLDGFSTTAPIVSNQALDLPALTDAKLQESTVDGGVGLIQIAAGSATPTTPIIKGCINDGVDPACAPYFSKLADGGTPTGNPEVLAIVPQVPLDEKSTYAGFITTDLKDTTSKTVVPTGAFALFRMKNPLVDSNGKSLVTGVSDAQAAAVEPLRQQLSPVISAIEAAGTPRSKLALAWAFTTQSEVSILKQLHDYPSVLPGLPKLLGPDSNAQTYAFDVTSTVKPSIPNNSAVGKVYSGAYISADATGNSSTGTLDVNNPKIGRSFFLMTVPNTAMPASGYPVTIFGHGLTRSHYDMLAIAGALSAAGQVVIATDVNHHGERTSCAGAVNGTASGDAAVCNGPAGTTCNESTGRCTSPTTPPCDQAFVDAATHTTGVPGDIFCQQIATGGPYGQCVNRGGGTFTCEGADFARDTSHDPMSSGLGFLNTTNLFATRDNFRQHVIELGQLARVVTATGPGSLAALTTTLDTSKVNYVGQSLGGILGTLFNSVANETHNVVLNVPGGDPTNILLTSPAFASQRAGFLGFLAKNGIPQGTPQFDQFLGLAKWILDPADPANMGYGLTHSVVKGASTIPSDRKTFIQFIETDAVVPNPTTAELIAAANRPGDSAMCAVNEFKPSEADAPSAPTSNIRHGFLLRPPGVTQGSLTITQTAQSQVATFIAAGTAPSSSTTP